ncbi:MAG: hypothetical protein ACE5FW_03490 [Candidatus Aenigmatarchaeota archaeon]
MVLGRRRGEGVQGATFGVMDGIVTALAVVTGLSATQNPLILLIGILVVGLGDSLADSFAFHVSEESERIHTQREIRKATLFTFLGTFGGFILIGLPVLFLPLWQAIVLSEVVGICVLAAMGWIVAGMNPQYSRPKLTLEYVLLGIAVSAVCYWLGGAVAGLVK